MPQHPRPAVQRPSDSRPGPVRRLRTRRRNATAHTVALVGLVGAIGGVVATASSDEPSASCSVEYEIVEERSGRAGADLFFTDDNADNIAAARKRGWGTQIFTDAPSLEAELLRRGFLHSVA